MIYQQPLVKDNYIKNIRFVLKLMIGLKRRLMENNFLDMIAKLMLSQILLNDFSQ